MSRHRSRRVRSAASTRILVGALAVAGTAVTALAGTASAATPDLVPDLAPLLTKHNDVEPAPAPTAPHVDSSYTVFQGGDALDQLRDFAPAGLPLAGLVKSATGVTKILPS